MNNHRSIEERIATYQPEPPKKTLCHLVRLGLRISILHGQIKYFYHFDRESIRGKQVIVLADHAGFENYSPVLCGWRGSLLVPVAARVYCDSRAGMLFCRIMGIVPKSVCEMDLLCVRQMLSVLKRGSSLLMFPEGVYSTSGSSMPITPGTVSFLKGAGLPVILARSYGMYMLYPLYAKEKRKGYGELHYELLFTPEELKERNEDELNEKLLSHFRYNDFEWNEKHHYRYRARKGIATGLEQLLYHCPCCDQERAMRSERNELFCTACGNRIHVEEDYRLTPAAGSTLPYRNIDDWVKTQRRIVRNEAEMPDFCIEYDCRAYYVNSHSWNLLHQFVACGEGHLRIDATGVFYCGSYQGENVELFFSAADTPSFIVLPDGYNYLSNRGKNYCFEPLTDDVNLYRNCFAVEAIHNRIDPVWDRVSREAYDG